jgi:hypothetical protein
MSFFDQMSRCVARGRLVSMEPNAGLPADFGAGPPQTDARFAFVAGTLSGCFLPESQVRSFEHFNSFRPNYHSLHLLPGYSHLDVFLGDKASQEVFPILLQALDRQSER